MEIVTVCLDALGAEAARPYVERAKPEHPSLMDTAHLVDERFGVVNIPNSVWIDEAGQIVRPAEPAWPNVPEPAPPPPDPGARSAPADAGTARAQAAEAPPGRLEDMMATAGRIVSDRAAYVAALRDWAERGERSEFALSPEEVVARSGRRGVDEATAAAEFELASYLHGQGDLQGARAHFREAHRRQPDNWTYKRQAWSLEPSGFEGPLTRFWQGPMPGHEGDWPYASDWVSDAKASGPENYYPRFRP